MRSVNRIIATLSAATLLLAAGASSAQQPPGPPGPPGPSGPPGQRPGVGAHQDGKPPPRDATKGRIEAQKEAAKARAEAAKERRDAAKERHQERPDGPDARKAGLEARHDALKARHAITKQRIEARREYLQRRQAAWQKDRKERIEAHRAKIKEQWGDLTKHDLVLAELRLHAWRMARLDAIKRFAEEEKDSDVVARADRLIERENARHDRRMAKLKENPDAPEEAAEASPPDAAPGATKADKTPAEAAAKAEEGEAP